MFVDEVTINARAGDGGDGVVRWRHEKFVDKGGPVGGDGGRGGDVYLRAVRDANILARYTGEKSFRAGDGGHGERMSRHGKSGEDCLIYVPVGATVTDTHRGRTYVFTAVDQTERVLRGGRGGLGNEHFKSATHRSPEESTKGKKGEVATLHIVLSLVADVGIIGFPNAGKSTLLNALTGAHSRVGAYPFTTTEPHLGNFNGYILADIPGLIHGASKGKGLGHTFLRHIERTGILLHCISLEHDDVSVAYETIRDELREFNQALAKKREIIVLTKTDLVQDAVVARWRTYFKSRAITAYDVSVEQRRGLNTLSRGLSQALHDLNNT